MAKKADSVLILDKNEPTKKDEVVGSFVRRGISLDIEGNNAVWRVLNTKVVKRVCLKVDRNGERVNDNL